MRGRDYRRRMTAKKERRLKTILTTYCRVPRAGYHGKITRSKKYGKV